MENKRKKSIKSNIQYMLEIAWKVDKYVIILVLILAALATAISTVEILIAPEILKYVEAQEPFKDLMSTIIKFTALLVLLKATYRYFDANKWYGRMEVRSYLVSLLQKKRGETSYENLLDKQFMQMDTLANNAVCDSTADGEMVWVTLTNLFTNVFGFIVYLVIISNLRIELIAVVMVTTILGFIANVKINKWEYNHREELATYDNKINYINKLSTEQGIVKDIKIFGLAEWIFEVRRDVVRLREAFLIKRERVYFITNVVNLFLDILKNSIAYTYLIYGVVYQGMSVSKFLLYFSAFTGFSVWIQGIMQQVLILRTNSLGISNFREFIDWPEPFAFEEGMKLKADECRDIEIKLENVSVKYPEANNYTIKNLNLTVKPGEKLGIVGLNGAGKTTLVKLICGLINPTEGAVLLNGKDIRNYNRWDYYQLFSAVFQEFSILEGSARLNIAQTLSTVDEERVIQCARMAGLSDSDLPNGMDTNIGKFIYADGIQLSGGQTQKLMLARALYKNGNILVLDEPTAALDPIAENDIYRKYLEMTEGKTSIFISHRLASTRFCDRIIYMENGCIMEEGTHESLLAQGKGYSRLYEVQSRYYKEDKIDA